MPCAPPPPQVPELKSVPARRIHEPWLMSREEQAAAGVQIGADYPAPLKSRWQGEAPAACAWEEWQSA